MADSKLKLAIKGEEIVEDLDPAEEVIPYTYTITSYGADYPVDSLVKRMKSGDILVPTFSWDQPIKTDIVGGWGTQRCCSRRLCFNHTQQGR